jgi:hypothetical protein
MVSWESVPTLSRFLSRQQKIELIVVILDCGFVLFAYHCGRKVGRLCVAKTHELFVVIWGLQRIARPCCYKKNTFYYQ